jgi:hypothetical protein
VCHSVSIQYVHAAVAGSISGTDPNDPLVEGAPLLSNQITGLGHGCPRYTATPSLDQSVFTDWNAIITQAVTAHAPSDYLFDIHSLFSGHGFNSSDDWYFTDCIHPDKQGHDELRKAAWQMITGEVIDD